MVGSVNSHWNLKRLAVIPLICDHTQPHNSKYLKFDYIISKLIKYTQKISPFCFLDPMEAIDKVAKQRYYEHFLKALHFFFFF